MTEHFPPASGGGRPPRSEVYQRLQLAIAELGQRLGGLPSPVQAAEIWRGIWFEESHHSTAIEGNTLVLKQVEVLLAEGRAVGSKELGEYLEVRGYADAAEWVYRQAIAPGAWGAGQTLTITEVREVHRLAMAAVWEVAPHPDATDREGPGSFRRHELHPFPGGMTATTWPLVVPELDGWIEAVNRLEPNRLGLPEELAGLHGWFERIHPFLDGNGRTGRLLLNLILVRLGYPPAIVYKRQRPEYLGALRRADEGDAGQLGELLARAVLDNLYRFVVPAVAGPARLVPLAALADRRISADALRTAAVRGRLQATKGSDRQWRSTRDWVEDYLAARYRRAGR